MQVFVDDAAPPRTHASSSRKVLKTLAPNVQGQQQAASKASPAESATAAAVSDELFENRALLHRVLREKQQLLARCTQQEVALRAAAAHESALTAELAEMESTIAGLAAANAANTRRPVNHLAMAAAPTKQDEAPAPAALHPPSPLPVETLAAAAHAAAAHAVAAREAQAQEAIERQAREAVERALLARSRECEELELRARFKEAQLEHQLSQVARREKELSSYCRQAAQQPQHPPLMLSPAAMSPSLSEPVDMIAAAIATAAAAFLSAAPPPPSDAMPEAAAAPAPLPLPPPPPPPPHASSLAVHRPGAVPSIPAWRQGQRRASAPAAMSSGSSGTRALASPNRQASISAMSSGSSGRMPPSGSCWSHASSIDSLPPSLSAGSRPSSHPSSRTTSPSRPATTRPGSLPCSRAPSPGASRLPSPMHSARLPSPARPASPAGTGLSMGLCSAGVGSTTSASSLRSDLRRLQLLEREAARQQWQPPPRREGRACVSTTASTAVPSAVPNAPLLAHPHARRGLNASLDSSSQSAVPSAVHVPNSRSPSVESSPRARPLTSRELQVPAPFDLHAEARASDHVPPRPAATASAAEEAGFLDTPSSAAALAKIPSDVLAMVARAVGHQLEKEEADVLAIVARVVGQQIGVEKHASHLEREAEAEAMAAADVAAEEAADAAAAAAVAGERAVAPAAPDKMKAPPPPVALDYARAQPVPPAWRSSRQAR